MTDKKKYTVRHRLVIDYLRDVEADSEAEAREMAYRMYEQDEPADDVLVTEDKWDLVEVEDD